MDGMGVSLTPEQLSALQSLSARHVAFSVTEACPLNCRHCIVNTTSVADHSRYLPLEKAREYACEMVALRRRGVEYVSFTGGEPLLAAEQLRIISEAAAVVGMHCTVVTSCHWARSKTAARRRVESFPHIHGWHLSTDIFHLEYVPVENVIRAADAAVAKERSVMVRMAAPIPLPDEHHRLRQTLVERLPKDVPVFVQPVTRMGRGATIATEVATCGSPAWPCIPNGMVVRHDGTVAPCCAGLVDQRKGHPFQYLTAASAGVVGAHDSWCKDPLLQLIRTVGFAPLLQWLKELYPDHELLKQTPRHPCECCVSLWRNPTVGVELRRRAELPDNRAKIAQLTALLFEEHFMGESV
jgi:pyruvate-formate lyase-activating enzyme